MADSAVQRESSRNSHGGKSPDVPTVSVFFGLSWWASLSAIMVGTVIGAAIIAPMSLFGAWCGTNTPVSSGAHFGVVGRVLGTALSIFGAVAFSALAVWTSGDVLVTTLGRILGVTIGDVGVAAAYVVMGVAVMAIAVFGFASMASLQRLLAPAMVACMILGVIAFAPSFSINGSGDSVGYLLGSFWATWALSVSGVLATVVSYAPFLGDWTRYISVRQHRPITLCGTTFAAATLGMGSAFVFGAYTASALPSLDLEWAGAVASQAPAWYILPLVLFAFNGAISQGCHGIYGSGLDFAALVPGVTRVIATVIFGTLTVTLVILGTFVFDARSSVSTMLAFLVVVVVPWAMVLLTGAIFRRGVYYPDDLQVFNRGEQGGRYWGVQGVLYRGVACWAIGAVSGLAFLTTSVWTGPLASATQGVDISYLVAGVVASVAYTVSLIIWPEGPDVLGPKGAPLSKLGTR